MKVKPLGDRVLVKPIEESEEVKGGIIIPDTAKDKPQEGEVRAVGTDEDLTVKVGDTVIYGKYAGTEVRIDGEDLLIMPEDDILAVVEK
ncbi:MAG TPA: co-chaperone GroES [Candidatus Latescibacteria bacterium]|nr:co-chaperone GroES [Candidatus Latescibacterota bacterium]